MLADDLMSFAGGLRKSADTYSDGRRELVSGIADHLEQMVAATKQCSHCAEVARVRDEHGQYCFEHAPRELFPEDI